MLDKAEGSRPAHERQSARVNVESMDDRSVTFHALRGHLKNRQGQLYTDFVRALRPNFMCVKRDLALGYGCLILSAALSVMLSELHVPAILTIFIGAILIGYWTAYILLFIHEGAHYNLAASREMNDRLCDMLVGWMIGTSVAQYRIVHFKHHRKLGTVDDSETTYFCPLNMRFLLSLLTGIRAADVIFKRRKLVEDAEPKQKAQVKHRYTMILFAAVAHGTCILTLWCLGGMAPALAWLFGIAVFFPFFGAMRQLLEHRRDDISNDVDFFQTDHGALTRLFDDGLFARTFGGAGFNRHLLHHWEPRLSYTNLPRLEEFLADTELAPILRARRTTYFAAFSKLMIWPSFGRLPRQGF